MLPTDGLWNDKCVCLICCIVLSQYSVLNSVKE